MIRLLLSYVTYDVSVGAQVNQSFALCGSVIATESTL